MAKKLTLNTSAKKITVTECFQLFIDKCIIKNLSDETIKFYQNQFREFLKSLENKDCFIADLTVKDIDNFILYLRKKGTCNDITINSYLRAIRAFLYYAMEEDFLPSFQVALPKANKKIKKTYTDEELAVLLKKPNLKTCSFTDYKMWVYTNYLLATGNRLSTVLSLKISDLDFHNQLIYIRKTKNRKEQIIPMSDTLSKVLREYLRYRKGTGDDYVFCNTRGGKGDSRTYEDMLADYNRKRGVSKTSAHLYRHTFAKKWILNGGDIFRLQKILGHSDLTVVKEYVEMFGNDLTRDFGKFNPLDTLGSQYGAKIKMPR